MKARILAALKTKYANLGLGERAFDGVASLLVKTVAKEEEIETAVAGNEVEVLLKSIQSAVDAERTRATNAVKALDEYKRFHPEVEPKPEPAGNNGNPDIAKLMEDLDKQRTELDALKANYENQLKQGRYNAMREAVRGKADELRVSNIPLWNDVAAGMTVGDDTTEDGLLAAMKSAYEAKLKSYIGEGAAPYRGDGTTKPAQVSAEERIKIATEDAKRVRDS